MFSRMVVLVGLGLIGCGRVDSFLIEQWEGPEATGQRANETRNKVRQYFKDFKNSCRENKNTQCIRHLNMIDEVRVVEDIGGPRIEGKFSDYGNGVKTIQILDKNWKSDFHLKHALWHEMGHAIGRTHGDSNLIMRSHILSDQEAAAVDDALKELTF